MSLSDDLVFIDEIEHADKGAGMDPEIEHLNHETSFLVADDAFGENT